MGMPAVGLHSLWAEHLCWGLRKALTLWAGEAVVGPAVGVAIDTQQCVLLLHPEPGMAVLHQVHHLLAGVPQVGLCEQSGCSQTRPPSALSIPATSKLFPQKSQGKQ